MSRGTSAAVFSCTLLLLLPLSVRAADGAAIQQAVDKGVAYLKSQQAEDGSWTPGDNGPTALNALALLECGVPATDPIIQKAAESVRSSSIRLTHTYSLSLSILFLDRLGQPRDVPLIESMTVRLLAGQHANGGWTYSCPSIPDSEVTRLATLLDRKSELVARPDGKRGDPDKPRRTVNDLPREIQQQLLTIAQQPAPGQPGGLGFGLDDNSNTQFALLGLWVAHRYGLPVQTALARVNLRFRGSQGQDGGWDYSNSSGHNHTSTATMTCAGLLGLGAAFASAHEPRPKEDGDAKPAAKAPDLKKDAVVRAGLFALSTAIGNPAGKGRENLVMRVGAGGRAYYFLWSLERVCVAFGLETLGKKDWYNWGAEILLLNQDQDGAWRGAYGANGVDTSFALLFLKRANLAEDLTVSLKGKTEDPGEVVLKSGGVGVPNLADGNKPALNANDKATGKEGKPDPQAEKVGPVSDDPDGLAAQLVRAPADRQAAVLQELRDARGVAYTQALASVIPKLEGDTLKKAREALAERLARMTPATLDARLQDEDAEMRRAAAIACAMKEEKEHIPNLIELLDDKEPLVARAAHAALKSLSGQDFGPAADAAPAERRQALAAWRAWWSKQRGK